MKAELITALLLSSLLLLFACAIHEERVQDDGNQDGGSEAQTDKITYDMLKDRRFQFFWKSAEGEGYNGNALLRGDGRIEGIDSPNESTWLVDSRGRLVFKHADGGISTRYDRISQEKGWIRFEGPFLLREGITHILNEVESDRHRYLHDPTPEDAARIHYSHQRIVFLDPEETCHFKQSDGSTSQVKLISVDEHEDSVVGLIRRAEVKIEIDDKPYTLICAPYVMPVELEGIRIQADTTSKWLSIPKRVQFSIWDGSDPVVDTDRFQFPLPGYRLLSLGMQAYNEPVHLGHQDGDPGGGRFYHNYGVDLAGYEGRQKVLSCISGEAVQVDRGTGKLSIRDEKGFILYFGHLDGILSSIEVGTKIERGQWVGMLGRRGASGNFSHLHVGSYLSDRAMNNNRSNRNLNLYPWLVAAYQKAHSAEVHAVARPHKMALTGEKVLFHSSSSMAFSSRIVSYTWEFHDKTSADGPVAEKVYDKPGCYMAALWIEDDQGNRDVDFCKVKVYSKKDPEKFIPILFVTYLPSLEVRVNQPVYFRIWPQGSDVEEITVDFGDHAIQEDYDPYTAIRHVFRNPGIHVVTVTGKAGSLPVTQQVKILVGDA